MENGFYSLMKNPEQVAVAAAGIEVRDGKIRVAVINLELVWVPRGEFVEPTEQQIAFLSNRTKSPCQDWGE